MKASVLFLVIAGCATTRYEMPPVSVDCSDLEAEVRADGLEDEALWREVGIRCARRIDRLLEIRTATIGDPPCPEMTWPECVAWAFDRSLEFEEKLAHARVELKLQDDRLRVATSTEARGAGPVEDDVDVGLPWWAWLAAGALAGAGAAYAVFRID